MTKKRSSALLLRQLYRREGTVAFVVVALIDAFHEDLAVFGFVGQGIFDEVFYFKVVDWTSLHCREVGLSVYKAPINDFAEFGLSSYQGTPMLYNKRPLVARGLHRPGIVMTVQATYNCRSFRI